MKTTMTILAGLLLGGAIVAAQAADTRPGERAAIYSSWKVASDDTGDCGGETLTLVRDAQARVVRGYLQTYEGNCEHPKMPLAQLRVDDATGALSFTAVQQGTDGHGKPAVVGELRFAGKLVKKAVTGTLQYCQPGGRDCNGEKRRWPAVAEETP